MSEKATQDSRKMNDFLDSVSFANYLTIIIPDIDALRLVEAWDYLSGIFLVILQGTFPEDDEFIVIVSPAICGALGKLLAIPGTTCTVSNTSLLSIYRLCPSSGYREFALDEESCGSIADSCGRRTRT